MSATDTDYPYYQYIRTPTAMGMSSAGSLSALGKDVSAMTQYVSLLVQGTGSKASATGQPLGNAYFYDTGATCTANDTGQTEHRFSYVNNIPSGRIPLLSDASDMNFKDFKGLVPGVLSNLNAFNPATI